MKATKRLLALFLVLIFVVSLASCKDTKKSSSSSQTGGTTLPVSGENTTVSGETTQPGVTTTTVKGQTAAPTTTKFVHVTQAVATTAKIDKQFQVFLDSLKGFVLDVKNPWNGAAPGTKIYESTNTVERTVEQKFGVTINETGLTTSYNSAVSSSLSASRPLADILKCQYYDFYNYFTKNYFARLNVPMSVSRVTMQEPWYNQGAKAFFNIDDKQVAWVGAKSDPYIIIYNKAMLKAAGLKDPAELVASKAWTFDKLQEYSKKLKTANRSGLESVSSVDLAISLIDSNGGKLYKVDSTGKLSPNYNHPTSLDGFQKLYEWAKDGTVIFPTGDWDQGYKNFNAKKTAMLHGTGHWSNVVSSTFGDEVGVVVFPKGPKAANYVNETFVNWIDFIPNKYQTDAAKILFLRNEMYRYSYSYWLGDYPEQGGKGLVKNSPSYTMYQNLQFGTGGFSTGVEAVGLLFPSNADVYYKSMTDKMVGSGALAPSTVLGQYGSQLDASTTKTWGRYKFTGLKGK